MGKPVVGQRVTVTAAIWPKNEPGEVIAVSDDGRCDVRLNSGIDTVLTGCVYRDKKPLTVPTFGWQVCWPTTEGEG